MDIRLPGRVPINGSALILYAVPNLSYLLAPTGLLLQENRISFNEWNYFQIVGLLAKYDIVYVAAMLMISDWIMAI